MEPTDDTKHKGFNPYRVFKLAATQYAAFGISPSSCFNPYRVFKLAATLQNIQSQYSSFKVSIPIGFSSSLQLPARSYSLLIVKFQSLSGFQARCNEMLQNLRISLHCRFNPYRVFKLAATEIVDYLTRIVGYLFQSLSGFQARCNGIPLSVILGYNPF